jgi:hypothetical protein
MQVNLFLFPMLLCIVPLVLAMLVWWTECHPGRGRHERLARTRLRRAGGASRGLRWTARSAVGLPELVARRWNGPDFYLNHWKTIPALSELVLVRDDIRALSRCSDRKVPMRLRLAPQTRRGRLKSPKSGPKSLN